MGMWQSIKRSTSKVAALPIPKTMNKEASQWENEGGAGDSMNDPAAVAAGKPYGPKPDEVEKRSEMETPSGLLQKPASSNGIPRPRGGIHLPRRDFSKLGDWLKGLLIGGLLLLAILTPFLVDYVAAGELSFSPSYLIANAVVDCVILVLVLCMFRERERAARIDGLRKTLNEAIIHDLKNPMTAIMASISCVVGEKLDDDRQAMLLNLALHGCRSQLVLIETLADTSRLEHGELSPRRQLVDTRQLLDACMENVKSTADHLGVKLIDTRSDLLPSQVQGDRDLLSRVFFNLILNALKYTPKGGTVSIDAGFKDSNFLFKISDTGIGIPHEHLKRLFKKYYRVEGPDQNTRRGSGLGLYFCRMVVEAHGGKIDVKSDAGGGTRVSFNIPQASNRDRSLN